MTKRLEGKSIVITGAAGELGRATAVRLAREGADLTLVGSGRTPLDDSKAAAEAEGAKVLTVEADVATGAGAASYLDATKATFGRVDVLFNNAGIQAAIGPITEFPDDDWDRVMGVNVRSVFLGIKHAAPIMTEQGGGVIVNMASVAGVMGVPLIASYSASKHAIIGLTKAAAGELAPAGIRVNAVAPGVIESPMMRTIEEGAAPGAPDAAKQAYTALTAMGRYGNPEEVAAAVAFLASDDSSYMTGSYLRMDGGMSAGSA
ncbi:SDR family oxidoreductase [Saccharopolyspora indica]|uniref:SDR family NAD(P)-dependent oxidoreductase n=1 Tax=Saccharopolyspora indica TaxID=1229659 RepID=UPI0022EB6FD5|nr:SDR family NAD(P)-dependent oxidoreductase [Saccharopolyspora indica]MDA3644177.1 SDR family NAD(P)-dependent oxidoreductase [Saccharopolyspora indica]